MITIKLFALLKERAGRDEIELDLQCRAPSADVLALVSTLGAGVWPELLVPGRIMVSVNQEFVKQDAAVQDGDEVALMPPFSGGSGLSGHVRVQQRSRFPWKGSWNA